MLGWMISVHRQANGGAAPATADAERAGRLAVWQTGLDGLRWLNDLAATGHAVNLGGNGYPMRYTAQASVLIPAILTTPPMAQITWTLETGSVAPAGWPGQTVIDRTVIDACRPHEWLLVVAWDES